MSVGYVYSTSVVKRPVWGGNLIAAGLGLVLCVSLTEIVLRVHNPIALPVRGQRIILAAHTTQTETSPLPGSDKLESAVVLQTNALGLRGEAPPAPGDTRTRIITVGGSTTLNRFVSHEKSWPGRLADQLAAHVPDVWLNNAGLDGNTTFGHRLLLEQHLLALRPDYVLFLIGVNDVFLDTASGYDGMTRSALRDMVIEKSELLSTIQVIRRAMKAQAKGLENKPLDLATAPRRPHSAEQLARMHADLDPLVTAFGQRVRALVAACREHGIEPVLVTQPALWGDVIDPTLGIALGDIDSPFDATYPGDAAMRWAALERYNAVTRQVGAELAVFTVDVARLLPKDSSLYFDWIHFSLAGNAQLAALIGGELGPFMALRRATAAAGRPPHHLSP